MCAFTDCWLPAIGMYDGLVSYNLGQLRGCKLKPRTETGIICLDEFDKIAKPKSTHGSKDISGEVNIYPQ